MWAAQHVYMWVVALHALTALAFPAKTQKLTEAAETAL